MRAEDVNALFDRGYGATCPECGAPDNSIGSLCPDCGHDFVGLRFAVDVYGDNDSGLDDIETDFIFETFEDASWYAERELEVLWARGERCIRATVSSDELDEGSNDPLIEDDVSPATLGWLPAVGYEAGAA